ncbi:MAG: hypothetical protein L0Z55_08745 [Planctomycetes bacterium]|nr:hypothetical protein [Planctomycetota bacterium]
MKRASEVFTAEERAEIEAAVRRAEQGTAAEIVLVVATRSGRYDRAEDLFGILCGLIAMSALWVSCQGLRPATGEWEAGWEVTVGLLPLLAVFLAAFLLGAWLATRFPFLARGFASRREMLDEVKRTAAEAFHRFRVRDTAGATGLLIFLSLYERSVWIVGDDRLHERIDDAAWAPARDAVVAGFRGNTPAAGLLRAVEIAGTALAAKFSGAAGADELQNEIRFIDDSP